MTHAGDTWRRYLIPWTKNIGAMGGFQRFPLDLIFAFKKGRAHGIAEPVPAFLAGRLNRLTVVTTKQQKFECLVATASVKVLMFLSEAVVGKSFLQRSVFQTVPFAPDPE